MERGAGADGHFARASALRGLDRFDEQLEALDTAVALGKAGGAIHRARAVSLAELGRFDEAGAAFEQAVALDPGDARTQFDYGHLLLHRGDFERGWAAHEFRLRLPNFAFGDRATPRWQGEDIAGKRLLVHAEQGLGDAIQMLRYLGRVAETGATVGAGDPGAAAAAGGPELSRHRDPRHGRRPRRLRLPGVADEPAACLRDAARDDPGDGALSGRRGGTRIAKWRERIGTGGFRIGVCWSGNPDYRADRYRSIPLASFAPLTVNPDVRLISLQALHGLDQLDGPAGGDDGRGLRRARSPTIRTGCRRSPR